MQFPLCLFLPLNFDIFHGVPLGFTVLVLIFYILSLKLLKFTVWLCFYFFTLNVLLHRIFHIHIYSSVIERSFVFAFFRSVFNFLASISSSCFFLLFAFIWTYLDQDCLYKIRSIMHSKAFACHDGHNVIFGRRIAYSCNEFYFD